MLGDQIKSIRLANKMSQVELARRLEISKQTVSNWENNIIKPSIETLKKICRVFSCSSDYLLELDDDKKIHLETEDLSLEQLAHIRQIVAELSSLIKTNKQMIE
ncbi:MAG: helix-turn-helix transcriptional regulator [Eubacterium sp.]|nr:helix-turn-helix transcriptional regulator [Eubacterium sp.]